jgi:alpha,alpha-trehalose-phosphate synthase [UDP-forming]
VDYVGERKKFPACDLHSSSSALSPQPDRLIIVSNRLPVVLAKTEGRWTLKPGAGGLVSALAPVLSHRGGLWIGWPGVPLDEEPDGGTTWQDVLAEDDAGRGYDLVPVPLPADEVKDFYEGFANGVLWPLFHDLVSRCDFDPAYWYAYLSANRKFAAAVCARSRAGDFIWVQDYQLIHVAQAVREQSSEPRRIGFFLHIPFPPLDMFVRLPWRAQILNALLAYDLLGFQTARDSRNFLTCLRHLAPEIAVEESDGLAKVTIGGRTVHVGAFPIGIDGQSYETSARSAEVVRHMADLRSRMGPAHLVLGVDRLDYTKGLPERLEAFRNALRRYPDLREKVILMQYVVPSREGVPEYQALKATIDHLVGEINGELSTPGWVPIHYHYKSLKRRDLVALYRMALSAFITSLKDGMNLVAKEFCACQVDSGCGTLILSEFAGAAAQLQGGALLVNPHDIEGMADALHQAFTMSVEERRRRMESMRRIISDQDIFWWVDNYLRAALGSVPEDFRTPKEYFPPVELDAVLTEGP